jgi:hypothetical protein
LVVLSTTYKGEETRVRSPLTGYAGYGPMVGRPHVLEQRLDLKTGY